MRVNGGSSYIYIYSNNGVDKTGGFIEDIELGYDFRASESVVGGSRITLVPCYYIYLINSDEPFAVYAYDNTVKTMDDALTADQTTETDILVQ